MFYGAVLFVAMVVTSIMFGSSMGWGKVILFWGAWFIIGVIAGVLAAFGLETLAFIVNALNFILVLSFFAYAKASS